MEYMIDEIEEELSALNSFRALRAPKGYSGGAPNEFTQEELEDIQAVDLSGIAVLANN